MKFNPLPWVAVIAIFVVSLWIRVHLIEQTELGFFCDGGGQTMLCQVRWLIVQSFVHYGLGYFGLFLGVLALISRAWHAGLLAAGAGAAGLVLYTWDYSAVAFLLGCLTLARAQLDDYRAEHGTR